ncbi:hypothetical protein RUM43_013798 [Polyplax serrata]|uniref:Lamin-B receptor n=1 Tax=Polyplax serrata TaxID=468196 RepID=A0AAN8P1H4_POLSC
MAKSKKSVVREKSPAGEVEVAKKKVAAKHRTPSKARKPSQARSKSRSRKPTVSKVRGRSRSRSRSRSKSKSPKRRGRQRSRSRSRSVKSTPATRTRARSKSRSKKAEPPTSIKVREKIGDYPKTESKLNEIIRRSISRELSQEKTNSYRIPPHTSLLTSLNEKDAKKYEGFSKESQMRPKKKLFSSFSLPVWFKTGFGLTVPPLVVLTLHLACKFNQCRFNRINISRNWQNYINLEAGGIVFAFTLLQAILSVLPIGKIVSVPAGVNGSLQYRCNGLLSTFLTVGIVAGLWHYKFPIIFVYDKIIPVLITSIILAYLLGFVLFIKGGYAPIPAWNPTSIVASRFHQFYAGREVNPFLFGKINAKVLLMRTCFNGMLLLNGILALKSYGVNKELSYTLITNLVLNALLVFDVFWFENSFPSTFEAMYEGMGTALTLKYLLYPFLPVLITKCIIMNQVELPLWGLVAIAVGFTVGFITHRASNLQKAAFRECPLNPALSQLEAITTNRGKKLLVSGWWGWVRHPNYLGFIILHWAWACASGCSNYVPYLVPLIVTLSLMLRARRVDAFCCNRYQSAWEEYCSRVRYLIFPHIY